MSDRLFEQSYTVVVGSGAMVRRAHARRCVSLNKNTVQRPTLLRSVRSRGCIFGVKLPLVLGCALVIKN